MALCHQPLGFLSRPDRKTIFQKSNTRPSDFIASLSLRPHLSNLKAEPITRTLLEPSSFKADPNPILKSAKLVPQTYELRYITPALKVVWHLLLALKVVWHLLLCCTDYSIYGEIRVASLRVSPRPLQPCPAGVHPQLLAV